MTVNAPAGTTVNGPLTVNGLLTFTQGMHGSNGGGAAATMTGSMAITGGDVTADSISLKTHKTSQVQGGSGTSGVPVP